MYIQVNKNVYIHEKGETDPGQKFIRVNGPRVKVNQDENKLG